MALYDTIQTKIKSAYSNALSGVPIEFTIFYKAPSGGTYNAATGEYTQDSENYLPTTIAGVARVDGVCRGILSDTKNKDDLENIDFNYRIKTMLVLDSELNSHVFDFDNRKYYVKIGTTEYQVMIATQDPAKATFNLLLSEVQA